MNEIPPIAEFVKLNGCNHIINKNKNHEKNIEILYSY